MIIDPRGLTVIEWCDYMTDELTGFALAPRLDNSNEWRDWARVVIEAPAIAALNPPNPFVFESWLDWAERFNQVVNLPT